MAFFSDFTFLFLLFQLALPSSPLRLSDLVINGPSQSTSPSELIGKRHPLASSSSDSPAESSEIILRPGRTSAPDTSAAKRAARHSVEADETLEEESEEEEEDDDDDDVKLDESLADGLENAEVRDWARRVSGDELKTIDILGKGNDGDPP